MMKTIYHQQMRVVEQLLTQSLYQKKVTLPKTNQFLNLSTSHAVNLIKKTFSTVKAAFAGDFFGNEENNFS